MKVLLLFAIRAYRYVLSPWLGRACRFVPTCSEYALDAVEQHGAADGALLAAWRVARCHPFGGGGLDPVPARGPLARLWARLRLKAQAQAQARLLRMHVAPHADQDSVTAAGAAVAVAVATPCPAAQRCACPPAATAMQRNEQVADIAAGRAGRVGGNKPPPGLAT